jgi:hypothetical protein
VFFLFFSMRVPKSNRSWRLFFVFFLFNHQSLSELMPPRQLWVPRQGMKRSEQVQPSISPKRRRKGGMAHDGQKLAGNRNNRNGTDISVNLQVENLNDRILPLYFSRARLFLPLPI